MSNLKGSILITGANGGLGSAFVANFIQSPMALEYRGLFVVRNTATANDLRKVLAKAPKSLKFELLALDLSSLESVRSLAQDLNARVASGAIEPIRALVLNAAWQECNEDTLKPKTITKDGFEGNFGINYLANFSFVLQILQSMDRQHGRIVIVSSSTHDPYDPSNNMMGIYGGDEFNVMVPSLEILVKGIEYTDDGFKAGVRRYGASKALMVMFMYELQRRLEADSILSKISVLAVDPGGMGGTGMTRNGSRSIRMGSEWVAYFLQEIMVIFMPNGPLRTPRKSARDVMLACFDEAILGSNPKPVYLNGSALGKTSVESRDQVKQKTVWEGSLKLARIGDGDTILEAWR